MPELMLEAGIRAALLAAAAALILLIAHIKQASARHAIWTGVLLVMLALLLPLYMAMWFAPSLIVFHGQGPGEAMKYSFVACLKNIVPFFLYSVIFFLLSFVASLPAFLGWLVLAPVMAASLYTGYRDIFFD